MSKLIRFARLSVYATLAAMVLMSSQAYADEAVYQERKEFMEGLGKSMRAFSNYLKRGDGEPLELGAMASEIAQNAAMIPSLFPPGTGMAQNEESEAKPAIWESWNDFVAAADALAPPAQKLEAAFEAGDKGDIGAAVKALGRQGCGGCHKKFREKKE